jgi:hypothetical protein
LIASLSDDEEIIVHEKNNAKKGATRVYYQEKNFDIHDEALLLYI